MLEVEDNRSKTSIVSSDPLCEECLDVIREDLEEQYGHRPVSIACSNEGLRINICVNVSPGDRAELVERLEEDITHCRRHHQGG